MQQLLVFIARASIESDAKLMLDGVKCIERVQNRSLIAYSLLREYANEEVEERGNCIGKGRN